MIQLLPCPACSRETVLPRSASLDASIRCPHCKESFQLGELLRKEYGFWEVTHDPRPITTPTAPPHYADRESGRATLQPAEEFADEDFELAPVEPRGVRAVQAEPEKPTDWSKFKPITHEQHERMKRKSRSPLWSVFQVVLGGIAAVPIALLILWHGLGRDVMDAGPLVGQYAPWIVPQQFRPPPNRLQDAQADDDETDIPQSGSSGFRRFDDLESQNASPRERNADADAGSAAAEQMPAAPTSPAPQSNIGADSKTGTQASGESDEQAFLLHAAESTAAEQNVFAAIRRCEQMLVKWSESVDDSAQQRRALAQIVYSELVSLALLIDKLPAGNPVLRTIRDHMQSIGGKAKRKPEIQDLIQQGAKYSLTAIDSETKLSYGLALIVQNDQVIESTDFWEIIPTSDSAPPLPDASSIKLLVPKYLAPRLIAEQQLFLLGTLRRAVPQVAPKTEAKTESGDVAAPTAFVFEASYLYSFGH